jgi:hypothetical protein
VGKDCCSLKIIIYLHHEIYDCVELYLNVADIAYPFSYV